MTQEEKATAYDEALKRAKEINSERKAQPFDIMLKVFPELTESEDEKIRNEIIKFLELPHPQFVGKRDREKWIAWLEKQSNKKPTIEMITPEESLGITPEEWNKIEDECIFGEDKPKFKVGDWIVSSYNSVAYIESISDTKYNLQCKDGFHEKLSIKYIDRYWHLWTIQDAKDGDVLIASDGSIFLFKCVIDCGCKHYIALTTDNTIKFNEELEHYWETSRAIHPATKEQRDLLFQKMKENGYEWNAEKKELKKIESNLTEFEIAVKNVMEEAIEAGDTHNLKADAENLLRIIKPAWTEEDEGRLKSCLNILQPKTFTGKSIETINTKWLKSLKERLL